MSEKINSRFFGFIFFTVFATGLVLFLSGCAGGTGGTADAGFPQQTIIRSTAGRINGTIQLPARVGDGNLQTSLLSVGNTQLSGFTVYALHSGGRTNGIVDSSGNYFIEGLPFGEQVRVVAEKGKIVFTKISSVMDSEKDALSYQLNVQSTAETLLFDEYSARYYAKYFEAVSMEDALVLLEDEILNLADILEAEIANDNVSADDPPITERPLVTVQTERIAQDVVDNNTVSNYLPYVMIESISQSQRGRAEIGFRLIDAESDAADVSLWYCRRYGAVTCEDGLNFLPLSQNPSQILTLENMVTKSDLGQLHTVSWESAADLGVGMVYEVRVRIDVWPANQSGTTENTNSQHTVFFSVDNTGLAEISRVTVEDALGTKMNHELGTPATLVIEGSSFGSVMSVDLEYYGTNTFISPRTFTLPGPHDISEQVIRTMLPAYGPFPVSYRVVLRGLHPEENSVSAVDQVVSVVEKNAPDFLVDPSLTPSFGYNDAVVNFSLQGENLMGVFGDRAILKNAASAEFPIIPISAELLNVNGDMRWSGTIPQGLTAGNYTVWLKNSCIETVDCGNFKQAGTAVYQVKESASVISSVILSSGFGGSGYNSGDNKILIGGSRMSSVFEARVAPDRLDLLSSFDTVGVPVTIALTSYNLVEIIYPRGGMPGEFYVGLKNEGGVTVSTQIFTVSEGVVPASAVVKLFSDSAFSAPLLTSVAQLNTTTIYMQIEADRNLSSLNRIRFVNQRVPSIIFEEPLWEASTFERARVALTPGHSPGGYRIDLFNAQPEYTTLDCPSDICFSLTEQAPTVTDFENIGRTTQLATREMYAWEGQLKVSGQNLAGTTSISICTSVGNCDYTFGCASPFFTEAVGSPVQGLYLRPDDYRLKVDNTVGSTYTVQTVSVVEKTPLIQNYYPQALSSRDLQSDLTIYFEGDNLHGTWAIVLTTNCQTNIGVNDIAYSFIGTQVEGLSRGEARLYNPQNIVPGEYYFRIYNVTPSGGAFNNYSACEIARHKFTVTEPELLFLQFVDHVPFDLRVASVPNHELTTVHFVGEFLYGLDQVKLRRRDPEILNISQEYMAPITGDKLLTYASFLVEPGLLPGDYDLLLKNSAMSAAAVQEATVTMMEVTTPVVSLVERYGSNDINTGMIVYNIFGTAIEGAGLFTKRVDLVDIRDGRRVPLPTAGISLMALPSTGARYLRVQIPAETHGATYFFSVYNSSWLTSADAPTARMTVYEPKAVFESVSVVNPPDPSFGFGENDRKLKLEIRGDNLSSVSSIELEGENMPGTATVVLNEAVIERRFSGSDVTIITTLPTDLRPGYYNLRLFNNNKLNQWSDWISPVESPFFQQVLIREGAPIIDRMGCLDASFASSDCKVDFMTRNYEAGSLNLKITGRNFYTFRRLRLFKTGSYTPEMDFQVPTDYVMGGNLNSASTGILVHTSKTIEVKLPQYMKYIGEYDIELTNSVSTRRFKQKLKVTEEFPLTVNSIFPNGGSGNIIYNNSDRNLLVSGVHLTGTTYVALYSADMSVKVTDLDYELIISTSDVPVTQMNVTLPENLHPNPYRLEARNTKGFNSVGSTNYLTVSELSPSIYNLSSFAVTNEETQTITIYGGGFLGVSNFILKPASSGDAKTQNDAMGITHQPITISAGNINILSHSEMEVTIPKHQLPGFYRFSMENTNPTSYNGTDDFEIQEIPPTIQTIDPDWMNYSDSTIVTVTGTSFLGVRGTVASDTWARLVHTDNPAVVRYLNSDKIIGSPTFDTIRLDIGKDLMLGRYELELKNSVGEGSSKTVTQFWVKEGFISLTNVSKTTFSYRYGELTLAQRQFKMEGKHFQGVERIWISTDIHGETYEYEVDLASCTHDPYVSLDNCVFSTGLVYPGKYLLSLENSAGVSSPATPVFDFVLPDAASSTITTYVPNSGPFNSGTEIIFSGQNLRRMEYLRFYRLLDLGDADDDRTFIDVKATPPVYPDPALFSELDNNSFKFVFRPSAAFFAEGASGSQNAFAIRAKGYFQTTTQIFDSQTFKLSGNFPEILGFLECSGGSINTTTGYYQSGGVYLCTTAAAGLPMTVTLTGNNFEDIQRIKLRRKDSSVEWTLACTTGTGASSFNNGTLTTVAVTVPGDIFTIPNSGSTLCGNDPTLLPLQPGVYTFVVEGTNGSSGYDAESASFYFSEGFPNNLTVNEKLEETPYNDENVSYYVFDYAWNLLGATQYRISKTAYGAVDLTFPVDKAKIKRHATENHVYFEFTVPKGTLRGLKPQQAGFKYDLDVLNSRGWTSSGPGAMDHQEKAPVISSVLPTSGSIFATQPLIVNGSNLFGVGRSTGGLYGSTSNQLTLWNKESYENDDITTISVDITSSVTVQSLTSFVAVIPKNIRPGQWFFSVENDHKVTDIGVNPAFFPAITYTVMDSTPLVTSVFPVISEFDELPTTLVLRGEYLSGVRTAVLNLKDGPAPKIETLSLHSFPDLTSANFDSVSFSLPQSPDFLQPGTWEIKLQNSLGEVTVAGFELRILEKQPYIHQINPVSHASFTNVTPVSFNIIGDNLFGYPSVTIDLNGTTRAISIDGTVIQSKESLRNLLMPQSLYPDTWIMSVENSIGSTSMSFIVTEPVVRIDEIIPAAVPYDVPTPIELVGDHFLGASTAPGSVVLTDVLNTPLEEIELVDRYKIKAVVPEGVHPGRYEILVANKAGRNTTSVVLTVTGSGLSVNTINPQTGSAEGGDFLTITGTGFVEGSRVVVGGILAMDVHAYPDRLEIFSPPASVDVDLSSGQAWVDVSVHNPDGQVVTKAGFFKYVRNFGIAPRVKTVFPGEITGTGPTGIARNSKIAVLFDMPVQPDTVVEQVAGLYKAIEVLSNTAMVSGTITWDPQESTYVYDNQGMQYIASQNVEIGISNRILNAEGIALVTTDTIESGSTFFDQETFIEDWNFVAGVATDGAALSVSSPTGSSNSVGLGQVVTVVFNKPVNPLTLHAADFVLTQLNNNHIIPVTLALRPDGQAVYADPDELLQPNFEYSLRIKAQNLESLTGNKLGADWTHSINTVQSGPHLVSLYPLANQTGVAVNTLIIAEFDQPVAENTVNLSNFFVTDVDSGEKRNGFFAANDDKKFYTFTLEELLEPGKGYEITVSNRIKSLTGVFLTAEQTSAFEASADNLTDLAAPVISSIYPSHGASMVSTDVSVIVSFNENMHPADINGENFRLYLLDGENAVQTEVSVVWDAASTAVMILPTSALQYDGKYRISISDGLRDLAGNTLVHSIDSQFTVIHHFDQTGPNIISITPSDGAIDVLTDSRITVVFDEPVDPNDVISQNFQLRTTDGVSVLGGLVDADGFRRIEFVPERMYKNTEYEFTVSDQVRDIYGNAASVATTVSFRTEDWVDNVPPVITLLTLNEVPDVLNGFEFSTGLASSVVDVNGNLVTPALYVPENSFTIDVEYYDPGEGGETSGVDPSSVVVRGTKTITDSFGSLTNVNLLERAQAVYVRHHEGRSQLVIPVDWTFATGFQELKATVKDFSGNISAEKVFTFQVASTAAEPQNYPFDGAQVSRFSLEFNQDYFRVEGTVQQGALRVNSFYTANGRSDYYEDMMLMGLIDCYPGDCTAGAQTIVDEVINISKQWILYEVRDLFGQDSNGTQLDAAERKTVDFVLEAATGAYSPLLIGGDNGEDSAGGVIVKSTERSLYNTANRIQTQLLNTRSATREDGLGVFTSHLIRKHANDAAAFSEWNKRFAYVSLLGYANVLVSGIHRGQPIGSRAMDADIYQRLPQLAANPACATYYDSPARQACRSNVPDYSDVGGLVEPALSERRARFWHNFDALQAWSRMVAVSAAKVAGTAVGAVPKGIPPAGFYGGESNLNLFFDPAQTAGNFHQPWYRNNILRSDIDFVSIFAAPPAQIGFAPYAWHYMQNRVRVTN